MASAVPDSPRVGLSRPLASLCAETATKLTPAARAAALEEFVSQLPECYRSSADCYLTQVLLLRLRTKEAVRPGLAACRYGLPLTTTAVQMVVVVVVQNHNGFWWKCFREE